MFSISIEKPLRVGTDCSGIEAPIIALQNLNIPFVHKFSSEIDPYCIETIKANFSPEIIFGDMTKRKLQDIPDIDLYVCGFPCQPFSSAGKREGIRDPRGTIFWECLKVIKHKKPKKFILENVKGLLSIDKGKTFKTILFELQTNLSTFYQIHWKVLNTLDYGIPQSRKRLFIVGLKKNIFKENFKWPDPIPCKPLTEFVDWSDKKKELEKLSQREKKNLLNMNQKGIFLDLRFLMKFFPNSDKFCSCICCHSKFWNRVLNRLMNLTEMKALQGFPTNFLFHCSITKAKCQLGNSMSVNVLQCLFKNIFL